MPSKAERITALKTLFAGMDGSATVVLADVGDLLRRSNVLKVDASALELKLSSCRVEEVRKQLDGESHQALQMALKSAVEEALQAHFCEDPAEQQQWREAAAQSLLRRDRMQSQLRALEFLAVQHDALVSLAELMEQRMRELDGRVAPHARALVPLNAFRRDERDLLNATEQQAAWWFSARSDCDPFLEALAGKTDNPHTPTCEECLADLERTKLVLKPPSHLTADVAFDLDLGVLPKAVEQRYRTHAVTCPPCRALLDASAAGDEAIEELDSEVTAPPERSSRRREEQTLHEGKDYRVILRRRQSSWRLLIAPRTGTTIASATLTVSSRKNALAPHACAEGLEFDLGADVEGMKAQLRLKLGKAPAAIEQAFSL